MSEFETSRRACLIGAAALLAAPVVDALAAELQAPAVKRGYVDGPYGQIHYRLARRNALSVTTSDDADIAALKRRRQEVQNSPVNRRDDKAVRRRRAELESLEQQLRLKESQKANQAAFVEREAAARQALEATRQAFLSWWFKE